MSTFIEGRSCRRCGVALTAENTPKNRHICRPCYNMHERLRGRATRNRSKELSGRFCSTEGCGERIHARNQSGLCIKCHARAMGQRTREVSTAQEILEPHPCVRCGVSTTRELCRDCKSVATALKELHLWIDAA